MWCTAERRLVRHDSTCLFQESIPAMPFVKSKCPLATRSLRSLRGTVRSTNSALCLHHAHPFVAASEKSTCLMQRSRAFGHGIVVSKICFEILWLCSQLCYETAANQRTLVEIELLATVGWKWGCQPFSCRCSQNVMHCQKEVCATCLFKTSTPAVPFWNSKHYSLLYCKWSMYSFNSTAKSCCFEDLMKWRSCILS